MGIVKYEDTMLILGQNYIFYAPNVVNFSMWFPQLTACIFEIPEVASHVTEPVLSLTEPGAVIKLYDFSTLPGTRMLQHKIKHNTIESIFHGKYFKLVSLI